MLDRGKIRENAWWVRPNHGLIRSSTFRSGTMRLLNGTTMSDGQERNPRTIEVRFVIEEYRLESILFDSPYLLNDWSHHICNRTMREIDIIRLVDGMNGSAVQKTYGRTWNARFDVEKNGTNASRIGFGWWIDHQAVPKLRWIFELSYLVRFGFRTSYYDLHETFVRTSDARFSYEKFGSDAVPESD